MKKVKVLSGGEKVRCLLSKMMISGANCPDFRRADQPSGHGIHHRTEQRSDQVPGRCCCLPPTTISSYRRPQTALWKSCPTVTLIDKITTYDEYLESDEMARKRTVYTADREGDED